jgi:hypothetical protein
MSNGTPEAPQVPTTTLGFIQGIAPLLVAIAALIFFALQLYYMRELIGANAPEAQWVRAAYLFGSVEAIAFAAAGFLFGREVNRQRAEKAEARADKAQKEAGDAREGEADVKAKAITLARLAELKAGGQSKKAAQYGGLGDSAAMAAQTATQADLEEVAQLAKQLFP